jgi:hypothetical protein
MLESNNGETENVRIDMWFAILRPVICCDLRAVGRRTEIDRTIRKVVKAIVLSYNIYR